MSTMVSGCIHEKFAIERKELQIVTDKTYDRNGYYPSERMGRNGQLWDRNWQFEDRNELIKQYNSPVYSLYTSSQTLNKRVLLSF